LLVHRPLHRYIANYKCDDTFVKSPYTLPA
jgi:hypothetical protein